MKKLYIFSIFIIFALASYAYDIAVENDDGVTTLKLVSKIGGTSEIKNKHFILYFARFALSLHD